MLHTVYPQIVPALLLSLQLSEINPSLNSPCMHMHNDRMDEAYGLKFNHVGKTLPSAKG